MANNSRIFEFTAAVRGFHVFRKIWKPVLNELLDCFHEQGNDFDYFSIKTCEKDNKKTVGHLPREISSPTKFLIDRGARVTAEITSSHYRKSPLLQGGLEIRCRVTVAMPGTIKNYMLLDRYKELVEKPYIEPKIEIIIGNFLTSAAEPNNQHTQGGDTRRKRKIEKEQPERQSAKNDIRKFFSKLPKQNNEQKNTESKKKTNCIVID